jgi:hypothetical protein
LLQSVYPDRVFWIAKTFFRRRFWGFIAGLPETYEPSAAEVEILTDLSARLFPIGPRRDGAIFDTIVFEPVSAF